MLEPLKEPITVGSIRDVMQATFPGATIEIQPFTGGSIIQTKIWQYSIDIILTTKPIVYGEAEGNVRMSLTWKPKDGKAIPIKAGGTTDIGPIKAFVRQARAYLEGIVAAISIATDDPPPEPEADLV